MINFEQFSELTQEKKDKLIFSLEEFIPQTRIEKIKSVLKNRTNYLTVVMEDIYQGHNASAIFRSCDCFGLSEVHIIEDKNSLKINKEISLGSDKWLEIHRYKKSFECIQRLRKNGYNLVAASLRAEAIPLCDFPLNQKIALFMGTEQNGLSSEVHDGVDVHLQIPMYGFSQSFNVSVSVALILMELTRRVKTEKIPWQLTRKNEEFFYFRYLNKSLEKSTLILSRLLGSL